MYFTPNKDTPLKKEANRRLSNHLYKENMFWIQRTCEERNNPSRLKARKYNGIKW